MSDFFGFVSDICIFFSCVASFDLVLKNRIEVWLCNSVHVC